VQNPTIAVDWPLPKPWALSPDNLNCELDLSGCGGRGVESTRAGDWTARLIKQTLVIDRRRKVRPIQHIKKLRTILDVKFFGGNRHSIILE
jgi:hypothetical protein